jgi:hypothetical protein
MAELAGYTLPPGSCLYQDKGFQGFYLPGITIGTATVNRGHVATVIAW